MIGAALALAPLTPPTSRRELQANKAGSASLSWSGQPGHTKPESVVFSAEGPRTVGTLFNRHCQKAGNNARASTPELHKINLITGIPDVFSWIGPGWQ